MKPPVCGLQRAVMFITVQDMRFSFPLPTRAAVPAPQPQAEACGLVRALNMLCAARSQTPDVALPFS